MTFQDVSSPRSLSKMEFAMETSGNVAGPGADGDATKLNSPARRQDTVGVTKRYVCYCEALRRPEREF